MSEDAAHAELKRAMALQSADDIDGAITAAEGAIALAPDFGQAHAYLGSTLVTRRRRFADGLAALERAAELRPDDPGVLYTLGWCREYVANAIEKRRGHHQPVAAEPAVLYRDATAVLLRARELRPERGLLADIEDILDVVAAATDAPWEPEESR